MANKEKVNPFKCGRCGKNLRLKELGSKTNPLCFKCEGELVGPAGVCVGCGDSVGLSGIDFCHNCV